MRGTYANLVTSNRRNNSPRPFSVMKIWFNEFLQNAAFPAVVLAFACSLMNNVVLDAGHAGPLMTDRSSHGFHRAPRLPQREIHVAGARPRPCDLSVDAPL
jgi:hypothetical protein